MMDPFLEKLRERSKSRGDRSQSVSRAAGSEGKKACDFWARTGACKHGDQCRYSHASEAAPAEPGAPKKKKKKGKKAKSEAED